MRLGRIYDRRRKLREGRLEESALQGSLSRPGWKGLEKAVGRTTKAPFTLLKNVRLRQAIELDRGLAFDDEHLKLLWDWIASFEQAGP
jgi:hypothetical protein